MLLSLALIQFTNVKTLFVFANTKSKIIYRKAPKRRLRAVWVVLVLKKNYAVCKIFYK
jgi:hypothetical protein